MKVWQRTAWIRSRLAGNSRKTPSTADLVADLVERLAVLLRAGVPSHVAWSQIADEHAVAAHEGATDYSDGRPQVEVAAVLSAAAVAAAEGESVADQLSALVVNSSDKGKRRTAKNVGRSSWASLAAAWAVATRSGAPVAGALREFGQALRDQAQLEREARSALAGPNASARLITLLPLIAVVVGSLLGFNTFVILFGNPLGIACLVIGTGFLWAARRWNASLARKAMSAGTDRAMELNLLAIALSGGASIEHSRRLTADALDRYANDPNPLADLDQLVGMAAGAGAPIAPLLRAEAVRRRQVARTEAATRAAKLGVQLMAPLGVCVLPAFVLLGVAPLIISVVSSTLGGGS